MVHRHLLPTVCVAALAILVGTCGFAVYNFMCLADAESTVGAFVHQTVEGGPAVPRPLHQPSQAELRMLARAQRIGPLVALRSPQCAVQADPANLCAGQILACLVQGRGSNGTFEADIALCRRGNLDHYHLARSIWRFRFDRGEPTEPVPASPI